MKDLDVKEPIPKDLVLGNDSSAKDSTDETKQNDLSSKKSSGDTVAKSPSEDSIIWFIAAVEG